MCSGLYGLLLVVVCVAFLSAELATNQIPLHYFEVRDRDRERENANPQQGCSRSIDLGGKDQDHLIELDLL